jgi:NAD(P)H-hydrate repair Nnr-like enzyme with NAD(P)H-hydrate epimerase domain
MFEPLYTAEEMRAAEAGHDVGVMMESAGRAVAQAVLRRYPDARRVAAVCGKGANGGDGRIALRVLADAGRETTEELEGPVDVVIDALFGTGFRGEPRAEAAAQIERMNAADAPIVAVDLPSGVDANTGEVAGAAVEADATVTMHGRKVGLVVAPGRFHAGDVEVADIGLEQADTEHRLVTEEILGLVPRKHERDTKYSAGAVLVIGGSPGMTGAVSLTAEAAFRADAGYVAVATHEASLPVVELRLLEAVKAPLGRIHELAKRSSAIAIGPGLGRGGEERSLVRNVLSEQALPAVVDADALFELQPANWPAPRVLTPHAGELARLVGEESAWVDAHRLEAVRRAADAYS